MLLKEANFSLKVKSNAGIRDTTTESFYVQKIKRQECMPNIYLSAVRNARVHLCSGVNVNSSAIDDRTVSV